MPKAPMTAATEASKDGCKNNNYIWDDGYNSNDDSCNTINSYNNINFKSI
jgi:hypothetical protein